MHKLVFFVPETHLEVVKAAVFAAGAGKTDRYEHCCWQVLGQSQFVPLTGSQPCIGIQNKLEVLPEYRVETVCADELVVAVVSALWEAHPYEEPAFDLWRLVDIEMQK